MEAEFGGGRRLRTRTKNKTRCQNIPSRYQIRSTVSPRADPLIQRSPMSVIGGKAEKHLLRASISEFDP